MRWLSIVRRPIALTVVAGAMVACAVAAATTEWRIWDLGAFQIRAPSSLHHTAGGIDSKAGVLSTDGLHISYDFGLYSDPLTRRGDMLDYQSVAGSADGLAGRFVRFRQAGTAQQPDRICHGVHVPHVRMSGVGALSLTVLACAFSAESLKDTEAIIASIRFVQPERR